MGIFFVLFAMSLFLIQFILFVFIKESGSRKAKRVGILNNVLYHEKKIRFRAVLFSIA
jgi:hypothetical protein